MTNSQSTAWAVQGLVASGVDPGEVEHRGRSGLDYLAARQRRDGSYAYNSASAQTPVWVTSQAALAVSREALPVERCPWRGRAPSPDVEAGTEPPASTAPEGSSGDGAKPGGSDQVGGGRKPSRKGDDRGEGGEREPASPAEPAAAVIAEQASGTEAASDEPDDSTRVIVAAGLGGLALALGGGWFWYRRRLP